MKRIAPALLICLLAWLVSPGIGEAHPADMYYHTHTVILTPEGMEISWEFAPGPMIAQNVWFAADSDQDNEISPREALDWGSSALGAFTAEFNGAPLSLVLEGVQWPSSVEALYRGEETVLIRISASWPSRLLEETRISLHNRYNPKSSLSWFEVRAEERLGFDLPAQNSGSLDLVLGPTSAAGGDGRLTGWESGAPSIPWVVESVGLGNLAEEAAAASRVSPAAGSGPASILEGLLQQGDSSLFFILGALSLAALLGGLHALSPGHGKTIVAAYLVGSSGKAYHAIALGAIVTLTHTGSVFALGLVALTASRYLLAADLFPVLELISGALILLLGFGLLLPRIRQLIADHQRRRVGDPSAQVPVPLEDGPRRLLVNQPVSEPGPGHSHDPDQGRVLPRGPFQGDPLREISWRTLVPLAVSGGLVPCPDAIAILLVAAAVNRIAFGLGLIISFSMGLAVILIAVGLLILQGKRLFERLRWFNRAALVMPVLSAGIVFGAGLILSVNSFQNLSSRGMLPGLTGPANPGLTAALQDATILYTDLDENQRSQLFSASASGRSSIQITHDENIWNFAVSPDSSLVAISGDNFANGSRILFWDPGSTEITPGLECDQAYCSELTWSPDGQGVLYSRMDFDPETNPAGVQSIWWLDPVTGKTAPLFQDALTPGFSPRWSPNGKWLSYTSINPLEVKIFQMDTGDSMTLPSGLGFPAVWSPDSSRVILQDIYQTGDGYLKKLFSYSLEDETLTMLAYGEMYDESYPAWSPDGGWLAVVRRAWTDGVPHSGNQVWIMRPDGTDASRLTDSENWTYGQPAWSADSRYLLFSFREAGPEGILSGIQLYDLSTGELRTLTGSGSRPAWLQSQVEGLP